MNTTSYKTVSANKATTNKKWVIVDANGQSLGRFASQVAGIIRGKHKPDFTPHVDCGDNVIVLNADKVKLSGSKWSEKNYIWHTTYPGGQRSLSAREMLARKPHALVEIAVKGMLPKNRLGRKLFTNLYVYTGTEHPHQGQNPESIELKY